MEDGASSGGPTPPERDKSVDRQEPSTAPILFLLGFVGFVGSLVAFVADLLTGYDVVRSLLVNAGSVAILVVWAARDTLTDPESSVDSAGGAAGTGLLLIGLYLTVGAVVVGVTSLVHDRFDVVPWAAGLGVVLVVVGFLVLPRERILTADDSGDNAEETAEDSDA